MDPNSFYYFLFPSERSAAGAEPVISLPVESEDRTVYAGNTQAAGLTAAPNPEDGFPVEPWEESWTPAPVITWPSPQPEVPTCPGSVIRPPAGTTGISQVRFLNAAYNYPLLRIAVDSSRFADRMRYASVTGYGQVRSGYRTVTVSSANGRVYLQRSLPFQAGGLTTVAVINSARGLDLIQIADSCCPPSNGWSNLRVGNLADNSGPLDVILSDGRAVFTDLNFKEVSAFKRIAPGNYQFFYADTNLTSLSPALAIEPPDSAWLYPPQDAFSSLSLKVESGANYTVYLLQKSAGFNNIQSLVLVDR